MKRIVTTMLCGFYLYAHRGARYYNGTEYSAEVTWKHKLTESIAFGPVSSISAIAMETTPSPVCASIVISNPSQLLSHKKC